MGHGCEIIGCPCCASSFVSQQGKEQCPTCASRLTHTWYEMQAPTQHPYCSASTDMLLIAWLWQSHRLFSTHKETSISLSLLVLYVHLVSLHLLKIRGLVADRYQVLLLTAPPLFLGMLTTCSCLSLQQFHSDMQLVGTQCACHRSVVDVTLRG